MLTREEQIEAVKHHRWSMYTGYCGCGEHFVSEEGFINHVLDAVGAKATPAPGPADAGVEGPSTNQSESTTLREAFDELLEVATYIWNNVWVGEELEEKFRRALERAGEVE